MLSGVYVKEELASSSEPDTVPVAVVVDASSVTPPVWSDPALGASLAPLTVIVTVMVSLRVPVPSSVTVIVNASVGASPASRAVVSASLLFRVYVHVAPLMVNVP